MNKIKDYIKENKKQSLFLTLVVFLAFATALVINSLTPYTVDDYSYMLNMVDRSRLTNFFDIFPSIYAHTMIVNGRAVPHFFVQFFLLPGMSKVWFNIVNSFVFVLLGLLIFFIANVKSTKTAGKLLLIYCLIFAFSPVIGQTCFWLDGACNYMWGVVTVLLSILPFQYSFFRETPKASSVPFVIFSSVVSFVAGTWSENTSAAAFCIMFGYIVLSWLLKKKVYLYMYTSFACCVLGWILMILSPGQLSRMEKNNHEVLSLQTIISRFSKCSIQMKRYIYVFIAMLFILFMIALIIKTKKCKIFKNLEFNSDFDTYLVTGLFLVASLAACFAMMAAPWYDDRSSMGCVAFAIISVCCFASLFSEKKANWMSFTVGTIVTVCTALLIVTTIPNLKEYYDACVERENAIYAAESAGEKEVYVKSIEGESEFMSNHKLNDLTSNPKSGVNKFWGEYFKIDIVAKEKVVFKASKIEKAKKKVIELMFE